MLLYNGFFFSGNKNVVTRAHMDRLKTGCIVCNMGHSNTEIDVVCTITQTIGWDEETMLIRDISWRKEFE